MPNPPECHPADSSSSKDVSAGDPEDGGEKAEMERECRICHLSLDTGDHVESGVAIAIELGCSCKDDLAAAHMVCAEAWFKIKGNKTCEICGSTALNVVGANEAESTARSNEANGATAEGFAFASASASALAAAAPTRRFWEGHRFLNFLLACIVFAFVISWLFHFNIPTKY